MYRTLQEIEKYDFNYHQMCDDLGLIKTSDPSYIVALTSFPGRIVNTYKTVVSLLSQGHNFKVVLTLSKRQFPNMAFVPKSLKILAERANLEILFCEEELKVFKKSIYARQMYPDLMCITVDDDLYYMNGFLEIIRSVYNAFDEKRIISWNKNDFLLGDKVYHGTIGGASAFPPSLKYNELYLKHLHKGMIDLCLDDEYNAMIADMCGIKSHYIFDTTHVEPGEVFNISKRTHTSGYYMHDLTNDRWRLYNFFKSTFNEDYNENLG